MNYDWTRIYFYVPSTEEMEQVVPLLAQGLLRYLLNPRLYLSIPRLLSEPPRIHASIPRLLSEPPRFNPLIWDDMNPPSHTLNVRMEMFYKSRSSSRRHCHWVSPEVDKRVLEIDTQVNQCIQTQSHGSMGNLNQWAELRHPGLQLMDGSAESHTSVGRTHVYTRAIPKRVSAQITIVDEAAFIKPSELSSDQVD